MSAKPKLPETLPWMIVSIWKDGGMLLEPVATREEAERLTAGYLQDRCVKSTWITETATISAYRREIHARRAVFESRYRAADAALGKAKALHARITKGYRLGSEKADRLSWRAHARALELKPVTAKTK
jgi:hypothetical protein